jgi:lipopolysaccharide/colanic/teichoic acid biosynthesis glycosyltransferase
LNKLFSNRLLILFADAIIVSAAFFFLIWLKPGTLSFYLPNYFDPFLAFLALWITFSWWFDKFQLKHRNPSFTFGEVGWLIIRINIYIFAVVTIAMYAFSIYSWSRLIVLGTILLSTLAELAGGYLFYLLSNPFKVPQNNSTFDPYISTAKDESQIKSSVFPEEKEVHDVIPMGLSAIPGSYKTIVVEETSENVFNFICRYFSPDITKNLFVSTHNRFNILNQPLNNYKVIINLSKINRVRWLNKFFEAVNCKLEKGGIFICCLETRALRKERILKRYPPFLNYFIYTFDYIVNRVLPKVSFTKKIYFFVTRGNNRVIPKAEAMGRLYSCGFKVIEEALIDNLQYIVAMKTCLPAFDENPSYAPLIMLERLGKEGKLIKVYKFRTMHAYSEYLQAYIFEKHKLQEGGKFSNDFRITTIGKVMRVLWLDELPMLLNLVRGELKLVGVRPLSRHYFSLYSNELQEKRIKFKPGLIPPYYAQFPTPKSMQEIMDNETSYLEAFEKHPFITDFTYFWKAVYNIIFRKAKSR